MQKTFTQKDIQLIAQDVLTKASSAKVKGATVVALSGDLGAGKTTLTQAIARELGVKENIISPTFILMKKYSLKNAHYKQLVHIDAYRFDHHDELLKLGWAELCANPENLILIEWPEKVIGIIPQQALWVELTHKDEHTRSILLK